jgi:segregation and condensation protein B
MIAPSDEPDVPTPTPPEAAPSQSSEDPAVQGPADPAAPEAGGPEPAAAAGEDATGADEDASPRRGRSRAEEPRPTPPPMERLEGAVEALLLASGEALSLDRMRDVLGLPSSIHVSEAVAAIRTRWQEARLPVEIQEVGGGLRVATRPEYAEYVRRLVRRGSTDRLSQTLLETLSIVAYKQPVARAEIERIRGVQCGEALRALLDRRLLKVAGRSDQPGRPLLYATTARFLEVFGLAGLEDLPSAKDLARL